MGQVGSGGARLGQTGSSGATWGQVGSGGARLGQVGSGGVRWGQVGSGGVRLGQAGSSGATWGHVGPRGARGQRGSFSITRGGHGVRWVRRGVYMKMGAHNTKNVVSNKCFFPQEKIVSIFFGSNKSLVQEILLFNLSQLDLTCSYFTSHN